MYSKRIAPKAIELIKKFLRYYMQQNEVIPRSAGVDPEEFWIKIFEDMIIELRKEKKL